jgi:hypothetical protein
MKLKVTRTGGIVTEHDISPAVKAAFELHFKEGFYARLREKEMETDGFWLAWECIRRSGETVKPFGNEFIDTLVEVEIVVEQPLG